jgi:hypothetical protein
MDRHWEESDMSTKFETEIKKYLENHREEILQVISDDTHVVVELYVTIEELLSNIIIKLCKNNNKKVRDKEASTLRELNIKIGAILHIINEKLEK